MGAHLLLPHMLCVLSHFSCIPLCDPMDHGPPGSSVHGIHQARILEWVAISFSSDKVWSESMKLKVLVAHLCLAFCDPMDCNPSGSSVHEILRVRILGWVAIPFSRGSCQTRDWTRLPEGAWKSLILTPWTLQSMEFSRPDCWSELAMPFFKGSSQPRDWTQVSHIAGGFFTSWATREAQVSVGKPSIKCCMWSLRMSLKATLQ